uniref:Si:ch211-241e1.3 n=1 Tax=Myripristis murdjan TaxID=586833 RepID=A0A667Z1C3_9TELE
RCVPCDCNGLANECDDRTGKCLNCQYNTAGDHCERCKEGYYGNPAQRTCRVCPCPSEVASKSFAVGCREISGAFQCICRTGYTGERCERCAPGFYGDPKTGGSCHITLMHHLLSFLMCKNTLEPKDTNTDEQCQECDNCAQTLLNDLEKLDNDLGRIKTQLDNASASATSQDRLENKFSTTITNHKPKVNQLEQDMRTLSDDISLLKDKVWYKSLFVFVFVALLDQLNEAGTSASGDRLPSEDLAKMMDEAQRMVKEMENKNFNPQKTAAEKERDEAKKRKSLCHSVNSFQTFTLQKTKSSLLSAEKIRGLLKDYEAKLKDLDEALKEAVDTVKKANTQNGLNAQAMDDLQVSTHESSSLSFMKIMWDELKKTEDLLKQLSDSKKEYEQLAAQLDGAKTDLTKKVNELSQAADKEDIVRQAEDHADELKRLAKELEDAVRSSSGHSDVRNAMDAIETYKNITDAINAAEEAANEAKDAADKALNVSLFSRLDFYITEHTLLFIIHCIFARLRFFFSTYKSTSHSLFAVKDLLNTIPSLNDKISEVESLTSELSPVTNISENIKKIKELIEQARDAANRIVVPMKFTGNGHVELRPPKDLEDLKAYTALSLSLQRPKTDSRGDGARRRRQSAAKEDMFVLYLGNKDSSKDYIGMYLENNVLHCVYKLNGVENDIESFEITGSSSESAFFDKVDLNRIYEDAEVVLTKLFTSNTPDAPLKKNLAPEQTKNLLNLSPDDVVFYVGGYPDSFTPPAPLNHPKYKGCIEFSSFNDRFISLYNFQKAVNINLETPCKRELKPHVHLMVFQECIFKCTHPDLSLSSIQEGDGTEILIVLESVGAKQIRVRKSNKDLVHADVEYTKGDFKEYYIGGAPQDLREKNNITTQPLKGCLRNVKLNSKFQSFEEKVGVSRGCTPDFLVRHYKMSSKAKNTLLCQQFQDEHHTCAGASPRGDTFLYLPYRPHFSLDVRTRSPEGLLFFAATRGGRSHLALYMSKGRIRFSVGKQKEIFNREKYNDGKWHSVSGFLEKKKFRLVVDGIRAQDGQLTNDEVASMDFMSPLYLGSAPESLHKELKILPKQSVLGCVRSFKMNGAPMPEPTTNRGVGPCFQGQTQSGAYFSGNGAHVILEDSIVSSDFELLFSIRPRSPTGVLLHVGDSNRTRQGSTTGHYLNIYMLRGEVRLSERANSEAVPTWVSVLPKTPLCDGLFHKISGKIFTVSNELELWISQIHYMSLSAAERSMHQMLPVTSSFVGCLQNIWINNSPVSLERLSRVFGPVNLRECPAG